MKIFIVEDNKKIRNELGEFMARYGYEIEAPERFDTVVEDVLDSGADIVLLDINLPVYDGYYVCREIRKVSDVPIIVVTSRDTEMDELMSMNLGADDFVAKPYNTQILLARIECVLKRANKTSYPEKIDCGEFTLDLSKSVLERGEERVELTRNEFQILDYLVKKRGSIVKRDELMNRLWTSDVFIDENTLSVNMNRIRKKLESVGLVGLIETKRGQGYLLL